MACAEQGEDNVTFAIFTQGVVHRYRPSAITKHMIDEIILRVFKIFFTTFHPAAVDCDETSITLELWCHGLPILQYIVKY